MTNAELTNAEIVERFLDRIGVSFTASSAGWREVRGDYQSEWKCLFKRPGKQWTVRFHMGSAHKDPPTAYDVLTCVVQDNFMVEDGFEDMMDDEDSETPKIKERATRQYERFKSFFQNISDDELVAMAKIPDLGCGQKDGENAARTALLGLGLEDKTETFTKFEEGE